MTAETSSRNIHLDAKSIADSRGRPTVEVTLTLGRIITKGDVPAGASKGEDEAQTVPVDKAIKQIREVLEPLLHDTNADLASHHGLLELERRMSERAGENYREIGANAVLPVSRALWRAAAKAHGMELYAYIREMEPELRSGQRVHFYMNIFNGGLHALKADEGEQLGRDRIDIQEIMVVPVRFTSYREAMQMGEAIDRALKANLHKEYGREATTRGDEAGFTVKGLGDSSKAIAHVFDAMRAVGYSPGEDVKLALDVAASSFYDAASGKYNFGGRAIGTDEMIAYLVDLTERYPGRILSIEDGLAENDWQGWTRLSEQLRERDVLAVGDDLFVTQLPRLNHGIAQRAATAILIKVNQNGSMSGTLEVMKQARAAGLECFISHRSGETLDDSIADLAAATGAFGLKTGDPQPEEDFPDRNTWVRRVKYLRMIEIDEAS